MWATLRSDSGIPSYLDLMSWVLTSTHPNLEIKQIIYHSHRFQKMLFKSFQLKFELKVSDFLDFLGKPIHVSQDYRRGLFILQHWWEECGSLWRPWACRWCSRSSCTWDSCREFANGKETNGDLGLVIFWFKMVYACESHQWSVCWLCTFLAKKFSKK